MITFRDIGVSNFTVNHLTKLLKDPKVTIVPAVNQVYMCISLYLLSCYRPTDGQEWS